MILLPCSLHTLEGESEDIPGHSISVLEDFSLIALCLLIFKQLQTACVHGYMLGACHHGLCLPFCVGTSAPDLPLTEGACSPMRDNHLRRALLQVTFHQEAEKTPTRKQLLKCLVDHYLTVSALRASGPGATWDGVGVRRRVLSPHSPSHCANWDAFQRLPSSPLPPGPSIDHSKR